MAPAHAAVLHVLHGQHQGGGRVAITVGALAVDLAARLVARHLTLGHPPKALIATLARALLREDAGFHAYQMLEAGVRQYSEWGNTNEGRHILIAVARYLAAHSPTERAALQTADIARRLTRGGELHQNAEGS